MGNEPKGIGECESLIFFISHINVGRINSKTKGRVTVAGFLGKMYAEAMVGKVRQL